MKLRMPAGNLPVLAQADAVVVGATFAGIACALKLSEGGKKVMIVEPRTYPGAECTAVLRPWLAPEAGRGRALAAYALETSGYESSAERTDYVPLQPDRLKKGLEDRLLDSGIGLLYATLPVEVYKENGRIGGIVVANKSGRQFIRCSLVADATETMLLSALCGEPVEEYRPGDEALYLRVLEFDDAGEVKDEVLGVPEELGLVGNKVRLRQGYRAGGHVFVELQLQLESGNTLQAARRREIRARHIGMDVAAYLATQVPLFQKAVLSASSLELSGPYPLGVDRSKETNQPDYAAMRISLPGVWNLFKDVYLAGSTGLLNAASAAQIGEGLAEQMLAEETFTGAAAASQASTIEGFEEDVEVRIPALDDLAAEGVMQAVEAADLPVLTQADVLVAGGGSSGASASITAAGDGMKTVLIDLNPGLGGTGTFGGVDSYWFGRKAGYALNIQEAVLKVERDIRYKGSKWNIEAKMYALLGMAEEAGVELLFNTITFGALRKGNRVYGAVAATRWGPYAIVSQTLIDATGDGDVAVFAGADYVYGSEKDSTVMWYSLAQFRTPAKLQNNFTSMVNVGNIRDYTRAIMAGRRRGDEIHDHGIYIATRESRHILGDTVMRLTDQLLQRSWPDVINIHFSNHDVKGVSGADWVNIGLIPPNLEIEIPYSMLLPKGLEGILVAGKAVSATHDALPAIRMQADLENLGAVAALAATEAVRTSTEPRHIEVRKLQERLIGEGLLPQEVLTRKLSQLHYGEEDLRRLADSIESEEPLYEYSNMRMNEIYNKTIPFVEICSLGTRMIPYLEEAFRDAEGLKKIRLAQALAMLGSQTGVPALIDAVMKDLQGPGLPPRTAEIMYVQLPPDHGAMPDAAYLLYSLAQARDPRSIAVWDRVADLFHPSEKDFKDTWQGLFYFVDAVNQGAERLAVREAVPVLEKLHRSSFLHNQQCTSGYQADYFLERRAMLELGLARAFAACGSREGYEIWIAYLADTRSLLAEQALLGLRRISGKSYGKNMELWRKWLDEEKPFNRTWPTELQLDIEWDSERLTRRPIILEKR